MLLSRSRPYGSFRLVSSFRSQKQRRGPERAEVEVVFDEAFDLYAVHYFVAREGDEIFLCCRAC